MAERTTPVPEFSQAWTPNARSAQTLFYRAERGKNFDLTVIDYRKLGWSNGDPRIVALNMLGTLTDSPGVINQIVDVGAAIIGQRRTSGMSVTELCTKTLTGDGYMKFSSATSQPNTITRKFLGLYGSNFYQPLLTIVSAVADNGLLQRDERSDVLDGIRDIMQLKTRFLALALKAYNASKITLHELKEDGELSTLLESVESTAFGVFRDTRTKLKAIGISPPDDPGAHDSTREEINRLVEGEIVSGLDFLHRHYPLEKGRPISIRGTSTFAEYDNGHRRLIPPSGVPTSRFPGAQTQKLSFLDGSEAELFHAPVMCPFIAHARSRQ